MGRVFSSLKRELKNFDVDSRALKEITKETIRPPPKYSSTKKEIEKIQEEYGVNVEDIAKKDENLNKYLKDIYVTSASAAPTLESRRQLPQSKFVDFSTMEYGYVEPGTVPSGKITLKITLELLSSHNNDPSTWTPAKLASHYNLDVEFVEQLIDRYKVFELHLPDKMLKSSKKATLASQVQLQKAIQNVNKLTLINDQKKEKQDTSGTFLEEVKPS